MCHLEKVGQRVYVRGDSFSIKDAIKSVGAKWDADARAWWIGAKKTAELQAVIDKATKPVAQVEGETPKDRDCKGEETKVIARVTYKSQSYYVVWAGLTKSGKDQCKLVDRKGEKSFWVERDSVDWVKGYGREDRRSGRMEYPTIGSLARFAAKMSTPEGPDTERKTCWECGCSFTFRECKQGDGDWSDSYCGC